MLGKAPESSIPDNTYSQPDSSDVPRTRHPAYNHDHHGHYTHELSEDATETLSRMLIRGVPLAYGALLGSLSDNLFTGLSIALGVSLALDLSMGRESLARRLLRGLGGLKNG